MEEVDLVPNLADPGLVAALRRQLAVCGIERDEALAQQAASAEILQVINRSPGDLTSVFDVILEKATRIGEAKFGIAYRFDGNVFRVEAVRDATPAFIEYLRREPPGPDPKNALGRLLRTKQPIHIADIKAEPAYAEREPARVATVEIAGARTFLAVPMLTEDRLIGAIAIYRQEVRPFSDAQIEMARTFANHAAIAIENARLLGALSERTHDLQESLEYQTATSDVLKVISRSTFDLQPVLNTLVATAAQLCEAELAGLITRDGDVYRPAAYFAFTPELVSVTQHHVLKPGRASVTGRVLLGRDVVHVADIAADPEYAMPDMVKIGNIRTALGVPLLREGEPIGVLFLARNRVAPFTLRQIELVRTFADQAVIAIENTRLLTELQQRTRDLQESLEYQTATSDVLKVISRSTFDLQPVLDALVETAARLCRAEVAGITTREGDEYRGVAVFAASPEYAEFWRNLRVKPSRTTVTGRVALQRQVVHVADVTMDPEYDLPEAVKVGSLRTVLGVPLLRAGEPIGVIMLGHYAVAPFTERQIELVRTFADQAVIAIENTRLLTELRGRTRDLQESLRYQTATSDVLKVISRSAFDLQPVLDTLVETAAQLCQADLASINNRDGEVYRVAASFDYSPELSAYARSFPMTPGRGTVTGRAALERQVVHVADLAADAEYAAPGWITHGKIRTALGVPLLREGEPIGVIFLARQRVEPFTDRQIDLVRTFADQAVIAIENTRLLTELQGRTRDLQEALEYQTATSDVLKVISRSAFDLQPVLDTVVDTAARLCGADDAGLTLRDGEVYRYVATTSSHSSDYGRVLRERAFKPGPGTMAGRVALEGKVVHVADIAADPDYAFPEGLAVSRTLLGVPLSRDGVVVGTLTLSRQRVEPFAQRQVDLVQTFADQAVIAVENARLLGELRDRTDELARREAELRVTFDNMGDGVVMFDNELRLAAWNRNFQGLLDVPDAFLAERPSYADYIHHLAAGGEFRGSDFESEIERRLTETDRPLQLERTRPDGRVIEVRRNPVPGGGFVLIYSDITERKRAEADIRAARDAAERALGELKAAQANLIQAEKMASLGQLTAGIAHEIKNPLNFVNNFASLSNELLAELKDIAAPALKTLDDEQRAALDEIVGMLAGNLDKIVEHGRRADGIVKSMLAHSRGGSGDRQAVDLNALIEESLNLAYHGARAQDQNFNITLERDFDPAIKPIELVPQDITRVFLNLFGNGFYAANKRARTYADGQFRPVLRVATHDAGDAVEIRVRDNGVGIPAEIRDKLFQPFFTTKPTGEGTGLGLSISYDIVTQQHGGAIAVDSEEGVFTEFTVRLPRGGRALPAKGLS
jgi:two-component system, NtrC family, sensor kinase